MHQTPSGRLVMYVPEEWAMTEVSGAERVRMLQNTRGEGVRAYKDMMFYVLVHTDSRDTPMWRGFFEPGELVAFTRVMNSMLWELGTDPLV